MSFNDKSNCGLFTGTPTQSERSAEKKSRGSKYASRQGMKRMQFHQDQDQTDRKTAEACLVVLLKQRSCLF